MDLGIFETVFKRATLEATFAAVAEAGFSSVQFHFESAGLDPWTSPAPSHHVRHIRQAADAAGVRIPAVSGTYNMAHPDPARRAVGLAGFETVADGAAALGASFVTICTGTRDTSSMWRHHPDNVTTEARSDMVGSVAAALEIADRLGLTLVVEPEPANIVSSASKARNLLDQLDHSRLKIVLDPANIVLSDRSRSPESVLEESFALLGPDIVFAHAKDLEAGGDFCAAGTGIVPWTRYRELLRGIGYEGDVIFHTLTEADVPRALALFL